eukprot:TRINITY_DN1003_c0_g1_i2.p1 TRINITY_DN1003_c0_g1~~TRINITY_DN1003_c0_g1_i2.p1  ORF type:complete len:267 (-),score=47.26 TRINITY_DN1003_c0_g1_i2:583-1383(-)
MSSGNEQKTVWYFAYGSNLNEKIFSGRRKIKPLDKKLCILDGWRLIFNLRALPFMEPCFANVEPIRKDCLMTEDHPKCVHGVAYKITEEQLDQVYRTEGDGRPGGYKIVPVKVKCYGNSELLDAVTLHVAYDEISWHKDYAPSKRYMNLILTGCEQEGIHPDYIAWLKKHSFLDRAELKKEAPVIFYMSFAFLATMAPIFLFIIVPSFALSSIKATTRRFRRIVLYPADLTWRVAGVLFWWAHDLVVSSIGSPKIQQLLMSSHQNM